MSVGTEGAIEGMKPSQRRRAKTSAAYRAEQERLAISEGIARLVVKRRGELGLSQEEVARRVGTSYSAISRLESGRHKTSVETLQRVAEALGVRLVLGFERGPRHAPTRHLVSVAESVKPFETTGRSFKLSGSPPSLVR